MKFEREEPPIHLGAEISVRSFEIIEAEMKRYPKAGQFNQEEQAVISRLIHTTTCFDEVIENIYFSPRSLERIKDLLQRSANIIVDVNMIKVGLSQFYLDTYGNEVICYINEPFTYTHAQQHKTTRSYAAVVEAIKRHREEPMVLVCGNAPTFIYAAINTLLEERIDLNRVALLLFPVGFVNVVESKAYARRFSKTFDVPSVIMEGRFGSSTMGVATLHAIYKLIRDYDGTTHYNGKK